MLPKHARLNLTKAFLKIVKGRRIDSENFKLYYISADNNTPLVGISISKKTFNKSSQRNKVKRKVSKAVEELYDRLLNNINLVIMPKASIFNKDILEIKQELKNVKDIYMVD